MKATQEEINKAKEMMDKEKRVRVYKRYRSLYLSLLGKTCREVAKIVGVTKDTVCDTNKKYKEYGIESLADKPYGGRIKKLSDEQEESLKEVILTKLPVDVGFPAEFNWTAGIIGKYINREYGYNYSIKGVTVVLARLNLSYTRPSYVLAKADESKKEIFKTEFEAIKKTL